MISRTPPANITSAVRTRPAFIRSTSAGSNRYRIFDRPDDVAETGLIDEGPGRGARVREGIAEGRIYMEKETLDKILAGDHKKGDVLAVAVALPAVHRRRVARRQRGGEGVARRTLVAGVALAVLDRQSDLARERRR